MDEILHINPHDIPPKHKSLHDGYEYYKRELVSAKHAVQSTISLYEIPPGKSAYPYHYHTKNEEAFYIISGSGTLRTPSGDKPVSAGNLLFFPANEKGAHKLMNTSADENLVYLDFGTRNDIDPVFYPDSGKIGLWGKNINMLFKTNNRTDYYDGE